MKFVVQATYVHVLWLFSKPVYAEELQSLTYPGDRSETGEKRASRNVLLSPQDSSSVFFFLLHFVN